MYGDQFRFPGRDDRQDGAAPQRAPWETGSVTPPAPHEDVKVAGSPTSAPPGGAYEENATGEYDTSAYQPDATGAYGIGAQDAEATNPYGGGAPSAYDAAPYGDAESYGDASTYEPHAPGDATTAYEADGYGATNAMPAFGDAEPPHAPDFEGMRRTPHADNRKLIRIAAVAAAVVVLGGGGAAWAMTGGDGGKKDTPPTAQQAQQPAPAPLTDAERKDAEAQRRKELKKRASRAARDKLTRPKLIAKGTPPPTKKPTDPAGGLGDAVPAGDAQKIARAMLPDFGWSPSTQFQCLVNLWNRESHWNVHAQNPSGAYGIPQALPGSKMSSAGSDWQNSARTQIKWGLGYIKGRYSDPCGAWAHSQATGWY